MIRLCFVLLALCGAARAQIFVPGAEPDPMPRITIAGSSTVAPFAMTVANLMADDVLIRVEEIGTGAGLTGLCAGSPARFDIAAASRPIDTAEAVRCARNGISTLVEIELGVDGIVLAEAERGRIGNLSARDIYLALARRTPRTGDDCVMVDNKRRSWRDVNPDLPDQEILVIGPPVSSGTQDMLIRLVMARGARTFPCLARAEERSPIFFEKAVELRGDGTWIDGGEHDHAIAHTVRYVPEAIGIFGFAHLREAAGVKPISIEGIAPEGRSIAAGEYPATRQLFLYTTGDRIVSEGAVVEVIDRFFAFDAIGPRGALRNIGLVVSDQPGRMMLLDTQTMTRTQLTGTVKAASR